MWSWGEARFEVKSKSCSFGDWKVSTERRLVREEDGLSFDSVHSHRKGVYGPLHA